MENKSSCKFNIRCVIALVLVVITFATSIIPAEAASQTLMFDLLTAANYSSFVDDVDVGTSSDPAGFFDGVSSAAWQWSVSTDYIFSYCYFTVHANRKPDKVQVRYYLSQSYIDAEYTGNSGNLYQYRVHCGSNNAYISVKASWNSSYSGAFNILSFVGTRNIGNYITQADFYNAVVSSGGGVTSTKTIHNSSGVSVPHAYRIERSSDINWLTTLCYVSVPPAYRSYNNIETISFLLHGMNLKNFDISLCDSSGEPVHVITPDVSSAEMRSSMVFGDNDYPYSYYEVTADLSSYDLKNLTIRLGFESASYVLNVAKRVMYYSVDSIVEVPFVEDTPWYKTFWNWLSDKWDNVTSSIKSSISSAADKITAAFAGAAQQNEQLNQAGQAMSDQADSMNQSQAELDAVEKPSLDPDNFFGDMLTFDTGGLHILSAITSNAQVTSMLVVVFTFALCGYIFFGKKG